jgi:chemotaxis protein MotB
MQEHGIRADQVTQVRGFADQKLRKTDDPLDPSNRRISVIVQYVVQHDANSNDAKGQPGPAEKSETRSANE